MLFITVHGTGDSARATSGQEAKWWEPHSAFCQQLLQDAPAGSAIEPFEWSGLNDELDRRRAAFKLYLRLRALQGTRVSVIGHSHGGSIIATALRFAAARRDRLEHLVSWTTIGTPFIAMKRRITPWERYNLFGQAVLAFAVLLVVMAVSSVIQQHFFWTVIVPTCLAAALMCAGLLYLSHGRTRALHSPRSARWFQNAFAQRWLGLASAHDEATNGLAKIPTLNVTLFDWTVIAPAARAVVTAAFVPLAGLAWLGVANGMAPVSDLPVIVEITRIQIAAMETYLQFLSRVFSPYFSDGSDPTASVALFAVFGATTVVAYLMVFIALMRLVDLLVRYSIGLFLAGGLNRSVRDMILKRAYGNTTTGELAFAAQPTPFRVGPGVETLPQTVNDPLLAYARANAAETLASLHDALFQRDASASDESIVQGILERLSWRELVHTAYFRVDEARRFIAMRILQTL